MLLPTFLLQLAQWTSIGPLPQLLFEFCNLLSFLSMLLCYLGCQPLPLSLLLLKHGFYLYVFLHFVLQILLQMESPGDWGLICKSLVLAGWAALHLTALHLTAHAPTNPTVSKSNT